MLKSGARNALIIIAALTIMYVFAKTWPTTYRYKMVVEVDTPHGIQTGAAVREVTYENDIIKLRDSSGVKVRQRGEAVVVQLPSGQALYALLADSAYQTMQAGFGGPEGDDTPENLDGAKADKRVRELNPHSSSLRVQGGYPLLVRFGDAHDPASVQRVDPDDLAAAFGMGVRLRRITVQMVDEPVTRGIEKRLPWLRSHTGGLVPGPSRFSKDTHTPFGTFITAGSFRAGFSDE